MHFGFLLVTILFLYFFVGFKFFFSDSVSLLVLSYFMKKYNILSNTLLEPPELNLFCPNYTEQHTYSVTQSLSKIKATGIFFVSIESLLRICYFYFTTNLRYKKYMPGYHYFISTELQNRYAVQQCRKLVNQLLCFKKNSSSANWHHFSHLMPCV